MLHTVISTHDIFATEFAAPSLCVLNGNIVEYTSFRNNKIITKLFSTDPKTYLDSRYAPGQILDK